LDPALPTAKVENSVPYDIRSLDSRYCGSPVRDKTGAIARSTSKLTLFRLIHACPSTGLPGGPCPGWAIDHVIPLACGGCDDIHNMQWLPDQIKNAEGKYPKDRWERKVYAAPSPFPDTPNCRNEVIN
jgi:5-methylcytosine-specific restriction endonuclease McrA